MTDPGVPRPSASGIDWGRVWPVVAAFVAGVLVTVLVAAVIDGESGGTASSMSVSGSSSTTPAPTTGGGVTSSSDRPPPTTAAPSTTSPGGGGDVAAQSAEVIRWETFEVGLEAAGDHRWSDFPVQVRFEHPSTSTSAVVDAFWDGGRRWVARFAPPQDGEWRWSTSSDDAGLAGRTGAFTVSTPPAGEAAANANYRGHLRVSGDGRYLERTDGSPFFWLGDTAWWMHSDRCPLTAGPRTDGNSCADYLDDRAEKGYSVIALAMFDIHNANEDGYPFPCNAEPGSGNGDYSCLNEAHFRGLDQRLQQMWDRGLVAYANVSWLVGQQPNDETTPADAEALGRYLLARYGWMPMVLSLSGEYQYGYDEIGVLWTTEDWDAYGEYLQAHDPQDHPLTIHPSSSPRWRFDNPGAGNQSSSGEFHASEWLDVNSIQSGQNADRLRLNPERAAEDYARTPAKPVLHSEGFYLENTRNREPATDAQLRWQAYVPFLNGAFGHIYGANGIWQMYAGGDASDYPELNDEGLVRPWWEVMAHPSSTEIGRARDFYEARVGEWWTLVPHRDWLNTGTADYIDGVTDPHLAATGDGAKIVVYFGDLQPVDQATTATDPSLADRSWEPLWFDPRTGTTTAGEPVSADSDGVVRLPDRPGAGDWALVLTERP